MGVIRSCVPAVIAVLALTALNVASVKAQAFTTSNTSNAGSWASITGQGFSPSTSPTPDPGLDSSPTSTATVILQQFQFFQGDPSQTSTANIEMVILNGAFPDLTPGGSPLTTTSSSVVGISTNVLAGTAGYTTGEAMTFNFNSLQLMYVSTYAAGLFTQSGTTLTPVSVNAETANYAVDTSGDADNGDYVPVTNYGGLDNYNEAADYANGEYYGAYSHGGDTNFYATLSATVPEPGVGTMVFVVASMLGVGRRRRRQPTVA
jgi:hypothetical protein